MPQARDGKRARWTGSNSTRSRGGPQHGAGRHGARYRRRDDLRAGDPGKARLVIEVAEATQGGGSQPAEQVQPIAVRLQTATADAGAKVATKCKGCHSFDPSGVRGTAGPNLYNVVGGPAAHMAGFRIRPQC